MVRIKEQIDELLREMVVPSRELAGVVLTPKNEKSKIKGIVKDEIFTDGTDDDYLKGGHSPSRIDRRVLEFMFGDVLRSLSPIILTS